MAQETFAAVEHQLDRQGCELSRLADIPDEDEEVASPVVHR
jgi:hypothetical protein